jgi:hypothetical protein
MAVKDLSKLIEITGQRVSTLDAGELARLAAHEYDEEAVAPAEGSPGAVFLHETARTFNRWLAQENRFPGAGEIDEVAGEVRWHREAKGSQVAQAYVDLGLFYSAHADQARGATVTDFQRVLDAVAGQLIFALTEEYGPLV